MKLNNNKKLSLFPFRLVFKADLKNSSMQAQSCTNIVEQISWVIARHADIATADF